MDSQLLYYQSHILEDSAPIVSYGVSSGSVLSVIKYDRAQKASTPADTLQSLIQDIRQNSTQVNAVMAECESMIATLHQLSTVAISPADATDFNYQLSNCQTETTELVNRISLLSQKCTQLQSAFSKPQEKEINELIEMNEGDLAIDAMDAKDAYVQEAEECEWNEAYDEAMLREEISEYEHPPRIYNIEDTEVDDLSKRADFERTCGRESDEQC